MALISNRLLSDKFKFVSGTQQKENASQQTEPSSQSSGDDKELQKEVEAIMTQLKDDFFI